MNFDSIKYNYDRGLWSKSMVKTAVRKGVITAAEYEEIVGEPYSPRVLRADRDYEEGEYLTIENTMYRALLPILAGTRLTVGTNVEPTTIEAEMSNLNKEEN